MQLLQTKCFWLVCLLISTCLMSLPAAAIRPLPADQAFALSLTSNAKEIRATWKIAPGYYLYRERVRITLDPKINAEIIYPQGVMKQDARHQYEVYKNALTIPVILQTLPEGLQIKVEYQGCSEKGFCYPPMHKILAVGASNMATHPSAMSSFGALLTDHMNVQKIFASQHLAMMLLIFAALGVLLAFTPCVLPMIPILTSIIVGHKEAVTTRKAFWLSLAYVMGSSITYALAGMLAATMGSSLQAWLQQTWIIVLMSALFVVFALSLFGLYDINLPRHWQNRMTAISRKQQGGTYVGVFIMGMVSTLVVSPCVTAPLVGVLMYIAQTGDKVLGASALFAMGLGMGFPLLLIGVSAGKLLPRRGPWMDGVKKIFGVLMLGMAVWMGSRANLFDGLGLSSPTNHSFVVVRNVTELNKQLAAASALGKPVMLDFYADWCESCVTMDKNVFSASAVKAALNGFVVLRADLTANNAADEKLLKKFAVIAPPTVVFFNNYGHEVNSHRIVGEVDRQEFIARLDTFLTASCDKKLQC